MPHPSISSPPGTLPSNGMVAQMIRLEPSLGAPALLPLLLARLADICWVEEEPADPGERE